MAPKRKAPGKAAAPAPKASKPRLSKLAKANDITNEQEQQISEAFALFAQFDVVGFEKEKGHGVIETGDAMKVMTALGVTLPDEDEEDTVETLDPDGEGYVTYEPFVEFAALHFNVMKDEEDESRHVEEVQMLFNLFTHNGNGPITIAHLKRVAKSIREDVDDDTLKDMITEANGLGRKGWRDGVNKADLEKVLTRAGVFGSS